MSEKIDELLSRKMDREVFLKHVGVGALSLFGLGAVVKTLVSLDKSSTIGGSVASGYGGGVYGGVK